MSQLIINVIGTSKDSGKEKIIATEKSASYSPDHLEQLICSAIDEVVATKSLEAFRDVEVSIALTADDKETIRPAFHLSRATIEKLATINAELDFDPYV
jgi:hypothetical protein